MITKRLAWAAIGLAALLAGSAASAQETTYYTYDALGRLVQVNKSGGPVNGVQTSYNYDAASNRTNVTVTNAPTNGNGGDPGSGASVPATRLFVVVPLNGYTLIPIN